MHGLLIVDKGTGITSARAMDPIKRALRMRRRVGHAGTLDPFATGVLIVLFGDVTRLVDSLLALPKTYRATVLFGQETETLDREGKVIARADPGTSAPSDLGAALVEFTGEINQIPPAYSALKVGGKPAYQLTRSGRAPELVSRRVTIHGLRVVEDRWPELDLDVVCGSGTYIRALARDLGKRLGLPAYLCALRRTAIGPFAADDGVQVGWKREPTRSAVLAAIRPPLSITRAVGIPELRLTLSQSRVFIRGNTVKMASTHEIGTTYAILDDTGEYLLGIGVINPDGSLRPKKVLPHMVDKITRRSQGPAQE